MLKVENNEFNVSLVGRKQLGSNTSSVILNNKSIVVKGIDRLLNKNELNHIQNHPNVVDCLGSNEDENKYFLILPYANEGNLRNYIKSNTLSYKRKLEIAMDIANGIMFLHMKGIFHGNLNPKNILIFDGVAKISNLPLHEDLYLKKNDMYFDNNLFDNIGYIDPNLILNGDHKKNNESVDVYSFGSLLYEIMSEKAPYSEESDLLQLVSKIIGDYREEDIAGVPDEINSLIKRCWRKNNRPSISEIYLDLNRFNME